MPYGWMQFVARANGFVANDLEKTAMTFGAPQWFWGLALVPVLIAMFIRAEHRGLRRLQELVSARLLPHLAGTVNHPRRELRYGLQLPGLSLPFISLAHSDLAFTSENW